MVDKPDFPIEYHTDVPLLSEELQDEIETRLLNLAGDRTDLKGASIAVSQPAERNVPFIYKARILVHMRPDEIVAHETAETLEGALKGALNAVERQVREKRKKLKEHWKRSDQPGGPGAGDQETKP